MKPQADYFCDWEQRAFGYGYGTGEAHIVPALRAFLGAAPDAGCYDYVELQAVCTPLAAWLLINVLCQQGMVEYGTSPRYGYLTNTGRALRLYMLSRSNDALLGDLNRSEVYTACLPDYCNCGSAPAQCPNPFWAHSADIEVA